MILRSMIFFSCLALMMTLDFKYTRYYMVSHAFFKMNVFKVDTLAECGSYCSMYYKTKACSAFRFNLSGTNQCELGMGNLYNLNLLKRQGETPTYLSVFSCLYDFMEKSSTNIPVCMRRNSGTGGALLTAVDNVPSVFACQVLCRLTHNCDHIVYVTDDGNRDIREVPGRCKLKKQGPYKDLWFSIPDSRASAKKCC